MDRANLSEAKLCGANLEGAKITAMQLAQPASLRSTTLPDGTKLGKGNWQAEFEAWRRKQEG